jgi:histo-blood group ABO system transferase
MSIGLIVIATGEKYVEYAHDLIASAATYFPEAYTVTFTDQPRRLGALSKVYYTESLGYPDQTLYRYRTILEKEHILEKFDHLFYVDADMLFVDKVVVEDIVSNGITATLHPGYVGTRGTPETREESNAFSPRSTAYYCGGFQGGSSSAYLSAAKNMLEGINGDAENGVTAIWHDESHWNRYLSEYPPTKVLSPSYCYPENASDHYLNKWKAAKLGEVKPILIAREKGSR